MLLRKLIPGLALAAALLRAGTVSVSGQLPTNFPSVTVPTNYPSAVANGYVFMANNIKPASVGYYVMIVTNDGSPIWYRELTNSGYDLKVLPNGYLHYAQQIRALTYTGGGDVTHEILDETYASRETIHMGNGYVPEAHDFQMLANGHVLQVGYYLSEVDMSQVVSNGHPAALVSGAVLQEMDAQRNVVFQWRSWDYYPFTSQWVSSPSAVISQFHVNCLVQDTDGHLLISTPEWVKKINRQSGDIMWHLGGPENQFTFVGVTPQEGTNHFRGHAIHRLANGHILIYNNSGPGPGPTSTVHEYALDETNKIATHIWTYTPNPIVPAPAQGNGQRLANGNTFVGWGGLGNLTPLVCTEVAGTNVVFQMRFNNTNVVSYRSYRFPYPPQSQANQVSITEVSAGNTYTFGGTGVSLDLISGGGGYNILTVTREPYAPIYPLFQGKAPRVVAGRVKLSVVGLDSLSANIDFDASSFGLVNPANITVAYRATAGQGLFIPQATTYNTGTGKLRVSIDLATQGGDLGEFIFAYPDLADAAYAPILARAENYRGVQLFNVVAARVADSNVTYAVNQQLPISLAWSPKGLASYYQLQVAASADFAVSLVDVPYQTDAFYVWNGAAPNSTYYYRVKTWNEAGASDWSVGSFRTTAPFITVTYPNHGEMLRRGVSYFIKWSDNIAENVIVQLYKSGVAVRNISTNAPSSGAFQWQVPLDLTAGNDYAIKITSVTNSALFDVSDAPFNIDVPVINAASSTVLPDGRFRFSLSAPGASQVTVEASSNFVFWQDLGVVSLTSGSGVFTDSTATNLPARFYRLRLP